MTAELTGMTGLRLGLTVNRSGINQSAYFSIEESFPEAQVFNWHKENWKISLWIALVYVILVRVGQQYMIDKPRFELRLPLILWSAGLAVFSIIGSIRTIPEAVHMIKNHGWISTLCDNSHYGVVPVGFWTFMFMVSKVVELGDTVFIVLRKQKLIFLHWYHHATVMVYVW